MKMNYLIVIMILIPSILLSTESMPDEIINQKTDTDSLVSNPDEKIFAPELTVGLGTMSIGSLGFSGDIKVRSGNLLLGFTAMGAKDFCILCWGNYLLEEFSYAGIMAGYVTSGTGYHFSVSAGLGKCDGLKDAGTKTVSYGSYGGRELTREVNQARNISGICMPVKMDVGFKLWYLGLSLSPGFVVTGEGVVTFLTGNFSIYFY